MVDPMGTHWRSGRKGSRQNCHAIAVGNTGTGLEGVQCRTPEPQRKSKPHTKRGLHIVWCVRELAMRHRPRRIVWDTLVSQYHEHDGPIVRPRRRKHMQSVFVCVGAVVNYWDGHSLLRVFTKRGWSFLGEPDYHNLADTGSGSAIRDEDGGSASGHHVGVCRSTE